MTINSVSRKQCCTLCALITKLWGTASNSNMEIIQIFQNKYLRVIVNASWDVNDTLHRDLNAPHVRDGIKKLSRRYADRLEEHSNVLAIDVLDE